LGGDGPCAQIEPYFAARIKTLAQLRISCSPKSTLFPSSLCHSPVTVTRSLHYKTMLDASLVNGVNNIDAHATPDSPLVDSPATPVDNSPTVGIKIDVEYNDRESDARSEPVSMKVDAVEDASVQPQVGTPTDPATIPIEPPKGTPPPPAGELLEDVRMAEESLPTKESDVQMADADANAEAKPLNGHANGLTLESSAPPTSLPAVSSSQTAVDSLASPYPNNTTSDNDDDKPPPAKRARKYSDAERASLANVSILSPVRRCGRADGVV